jgi:hypothetical protein
MYTIGRFARVRLMTGALDRIRTRPAGGFGDFGGQLIFTNYTVCHRNAPNI